MAAPPLQDCIKPGMIDLDSIKKLIALQRSLSPGLAQPPQLTPAQQRAVGELNRAVQAALQALSVAPTPPEPDLGDKDWVSLLGRCRDAHPDGTSISYTEEARDLKWCCFTTLPEAGDLIFPAIAIPFARKKDAKKYAARKAVEWLMLHQLIPDGGGSVTFKKPIGGVQQQSAPASADATRPSSAASAKTGRDSPSPAAPAAAVKPPKAQPTKDDGGAGDKDQKPANDEDVGANVLTLVTKLCKELGLGQPRYVVEHIEHTDNLFHGFVDWGDELRVPESVGAVNDIYGQKHAKQMMAWYVLKYLAQVQEQRKVAGQETLRMLRGLA